MLHIDDKWSVGYDPANNDRPVRLLRHGEEHILGPRLWNNDQIAMFYALLESRDILARCLWMIEEKEGTSDENDQLVDRARAVVRTGSGQLAPSDAAPER
jgi:hypothetical protein